MNTEPKPRPSKWGVLLGSIVLIALTVLFLSGVAAATIAIWKAVL